MLYPLHHLNVYNMHIFLSQLDIFSVFIVVTCLVGGFWKSRFCYPWPVS